MTARTVRHTSATTLVIISVLSVAGCGGSATSGPPTTFDSAQGRAAYNALNAVQQSERRWIAALKLCYAAASSTCAGQAAQQTGYTQAIHRYATLLQHLSNVTGGDCSTTLKAAYTSTQTGADGVAQYDRDALAQNTAKLGADTTAIDAQGPQITRTTKAAQAACHGWREQ